MKYPEKAPMPKMPKIKEPKKVSKPVKPATTKSGMTPSKNRTRGKC